MNTKPDPAVLRAARYFIEQLYKQYSVNKVLLFGSYARQEAHAESDIDLAVLLSGESGDFIESKLAMDDIAFDVLLKTGLRIQPLPIWENKWEKVSQYSNPYLLRHIQREGIPL